MGGETKHTRTSIDDLVLDHLVSRSGSPIFVNPIRLVPMVVWDQAKVDLSIRQDLHPPTSRTDGVSEGTQDKGKTRRRNHSRLELLRKHLFVQKHVRILIPLIKPILHLLHTRHNPIKIPVPRQRHNSSIRLPFRRGRFLFLHRVKILRRNPILIRGFARRRPELVLDVR